MSQDSDTCPTIPPKSRVPEIVESSKIALIVIAQLQIVSDWDAPINPPLLRYCSFPHKEVCIVMLVMLLWVDFPASPPASLPGDPLRVSATVCWV